MANQIIPRLTPAELDALEAALKYYDETGIDKVDYDALPALIAAARATVPEVIGEKHRDGKEWLVWNGSDWLPAYWAAEEWLWIYTETGHKMRGTPTHALPLPPEPEGPDA